MSHNTKNDPLDDLRNMAEHARRHVPGYARMLDFFVGAWQAERGQAADAAARLSYLRSSFLEEHSTVLPQCDGAEVAGSDAELEELRSAFGVIGKYMAR